MSDAKNAKPDSHLIWHYTNFTGVKGILEKGDIWLNETTYMNDRDELRATRERAREIAVGRAAMLGTHDKRYIIDPEGTAGRVAERVRTMEAAFDRPALENVFVASFSRRDNVLSQWRAYCPAGGAALGFDRENLCRGLEAVGIKLADCSYDELHVRRQDEPATEEQPGPPALLREMHQACQHLAVEIGGGAELDFSSIHRICALYKHEGFCEEQETRAVFVLRPRKEMQPAIAVREARGRLIRHIVFKWAGDGEPALKAIRLAPGEPHERLAAQDSMRILAREHAPTVKILESVTPIRRD
ncbi:DUF2971 domain-containing protein [Lichenicoccus sp.]|uniref:DUF2971 domain-containing protein n=1 Tax=Lichenicoccus sp. TaxID=2781899 RepID=UPI003D0BAC4F